MRSRTWGAAVAAVAAALAASAAAGAADEGRCELGRVDRTTTASSSCLTCHDGSGAPGVGRPSASSHPVQVDYGAVAAAHPGRFHPAPALPPEVPLVGGKVECTTCHDGGALGRQRLIAGRDLCLACHRL